MYHPSRTVGKAISCQDPTCGQPDPHKRLWTLHNRASEAARPDGVIRDELALQIYRSLHYDFVRSFGPPDGSHGIRSALFDAELRGFLAAHPDGVIVNLGEGLETQRFRVDSESALWLSVDVPEAMAVRERYIQPDARHLHLRLSALDPAWMDQVPSGRAVYVTAQGLLMYFTPEEVETLFRHLATRLPGAWFAFDHIPGWLSRKTLRGWWKTPHYRTPPMPWGIGRDRMAPTLRAWVPDLAEINSLPFVFPRGWYSLLSYTLIYAPWLGDQMPGITRVRFGG
ncbi:class I SAM-dependent methyltransferase [Thiocystis violascens]|uniref:O-methyltransferase involved in polyketide biosynthesis n=1 Tax=Thiocystis violascens (strain ATCC 17096 / DSM 198 / 6111) TaxID=765911 RepID=I3Y5G5_THIV6|nr:class I SAM-dependent methyltransferase [Thiocystis violascens]AFL72233.1 O-methyltransferase involved in polyketide biosynthesis [Thiocystis violascens DSM 198]